MELELTTFCSVIIFRFLINDSYERVEVSTWWYVGRRCFSLRVLLSVRECVDCIGFLLILVVSRSRYRIVNDGNGEDLTYFSTRRGDASLCRSWQY